jgi:predicted HNH restriction endonuclease
MPQVRKQLQALRDCGAITFLDNSGHYTLREIEMLESERKEVCAIDISREIPERREYVMETYVRNVTWARKAQEVLGMYCLYENCSNTFLREDGTPYIEVHHIIPLCKGGEDGLWNLSVLCAHHHRMAHYADSATRNCMEKYLRSRVRSEILRKMSSVFQTMR